jgi:hypothetical protein
MPRLSSGCLIVMASTMLVMPAAWQHAAAQKTPGQIPNPGTYEGSMELQRRQQEQQQSAKPPASSSDTPAPRSAAPGASGTSAQAAYATWEKRPALPADRNPLLGRWTWQPAGAAKQQNGMAALFDGSMANSMGCSILFGDGAVEFRPANIVSIQANRESVIGTVAYRGGGKQVVALQQDGMRAFLMFNFESPDRISLAGVPCVMNRAGAVHTSAASAVGAGSTGSAVAASLSLAAVLAPLNTVTPVAGGEFFVLRHSVNTVLTRGGVTPAAGVPPVRAWGMACQGRQPACQSGITALMKDSVATIKTDATGTGKVAALPPGTYFLFGMAKEGQKTMMWDHRVEVKPGANAIRLDPGNAIAPE